MRKTTDRKKKEKNNLKAASKVRKKIDSAVKLGTKGKLPITRKEGRDQFSKFFGYKPNTRKRK